MGFRAHMQRTGSLYVFGRRRGGRTTRPGENDSRTREQTSSGAGRPGEQQTVRSQRRTPQQHPGIRDRVHRAQMSYYEGSEKRVPGALMVLSDDSLWAEHRATLVAEPRTLAQLGLTLPTHAAGGNDWRRDDHRRGNERNAGSGGNW
jgi:hypothetical protein